MKIPLIILFIWILSVSTSIACMPVDADRSVEVVLNNDEIINISKFAGIGEKDLNYFIEMPSNKAEMPSTQPVLVYRSHFNKQVMVKVGYSPQGYQWRSILIVVPEGVDISSFDFTFAMQKELIWLIKNGIVKGLDQAVIPSIVRQIAPSMRFFTREMKIGSQGCMTIDLESCFDCTAEALFTKLPPRLIR